MKHYTILIGTAVGALGIAVMGIPTILEPSWAGAAKYIGFALYAGGCLAMMLYTEEKHHG